MTNSLSNIYTSIKKYKGIFYLVFGLLVIYVVIVSIINILNYISSGKKKEGFQDQSSNLVSLQPGAFPSSQIDPLLINSYPLTGRKGVSNNQYDDIWWHYPVFPVGSFEQITNNIKYNNNPDEGTCITADFCGALYKEYQTQSYISEPLPPVNPGQGARVNYYRTDSNLVI